MTLADTIQNDRLLARTLQIRRERDEKAAQTPSLNKPTPLAAAPVVLAAPAPATREAKLRAIADGIGAEQSDLTTAIRTGMSPAAFALQESDKAIARRESLRAQIELDAVVQSILDSMPNGRAR